MSNLSCGTRVAEPSANKDCRKLLNQFCRFLPKLKLPISADAKLPLTKAHANQRITREDAVRKLHFASLLMYKVDQAIHNTGIIE